MSRPPLPPFTVETAIHQVRLAEDACSGHDPAISECGRLYRWPADRQPDGHAGLAELGL